MSEGKSAARSEMNLWRRKYGRPDDREVVDLMLAHSQDDKTEDAYNRAAHMDRRRELARIWADTLLEGLQRPFSMVRQSTRFLR